MEKVKVKLYKFEELSAEVRNQVAEDQAFDVMGVVMDSCGSEYMASLEEFEKATHCEVTDWEVDYYHHYYRVRDIDPCMGDYNNPLYAEDIKGKLLFRWCYRFIRNNRRGKYYGKLIPHVVDKEHPAGCEHIKRYSKVIKEPIKGGWCAWTGVTTDCPLVEPIVDFYLNYHRGKYSESYNLEDLLNDCVEKFFTEWEDEYNAYGNNKDGCVEEHIQINSEGKLFYEDGREFDGTYEEEYFEEEEFEEV